MKINSIIKSITLFAGLAASMLATSQAMAASTVCGTVTGANYFGQTLGGTSGNEMKLVFLSGDPTLPIFIDNNHPLVNLVELLLAKQSSESICIGYIADSSGINYMINADIASSGTTDPNEARAILYLDSTGGGSSFPEFVAVTWGDGTSNVAIDTDVASLAAISRLNAKPLTKKKISCAYVYNPSTNFLESVCNLLNSTRF